MSIKPAISSEKEGGSGTAEVTCVTSNSTPENSTPNLNGSVPSENHTPFPTDVW
ncbi:hypothetical protein K2X92_02060 [Candidatus Gracilibacteria bacterium]|nr:hypothetical protein [Candidatus Gracilibacteria bacterium]